MLDLLMYTFMRFWQLNPSAKSSTSKCAFIKELLMY